MRELAEAHEVDHHYMTRVLEAVNSCRPKSNDADFLRRLIIEEEVCAPNLLKALQGWQASHPVGDDADPSKAKVVKKAPVDVVGGMTRSLTFLRNQAIAWDRLKQDEKAALTEQWDRTWALLPADLQAYAIRKGKTKDRLAALKREAELSKPIGPKSRRG